MEVTHLTVLMYLIPSDNPAEVITVMAQVEIKAEMLEGEEINDKTG